MNPFYSLTVFLYRYYYIIFTGTQGHINTHVYIMLQKMKSLCFTTEQGNYTFLAAN